MESITTRDKVLKKEDGKDELVQKWIFKGVFDNYNKDRYYYLMKWKYYTFI